MYWKISIIFFVLIIGGCSQENEWILEKETYLIEAKELKFYLNHPDLKLIDFRKKEDYENGHLPGAVNIWRPDIEDHSYEYKGMMASTNTIEKLFGKLGIKSKDTIVIYDDNGLCNASRLWWILQNYEFKNVMMLQGGVSAWEAVGGKLSKEIPIIIETEFDLVENPRMSYYVSKEGVQKAVAENVTILDTRSEDEFTGKRQKRGASKAGRIPNSFRIDWAEAINYNGDQRLKSTEKLDIIYGSLGIKKEDPIIVYCHSGVRSAHTSFVLTQILGYTNVKNYDGSWTEWSYFSELPFEADTNTVILN